MERIASCGFQTCRFSRFAFLHRRTAVGLGTFSNLRDGASSLQSIFSLTFRNCKSQNQCILRLTYGPKNCDQIGSLNGENNKLERCEVRNLRFVSRADACLYILEEDENTSASSSKRKAATMSKSHATALDSPLAHASDGVRREANIPRYASLDTGVQSLHFSSSPSRDRALFASPLRTRRYRTESDIRSVSSRGFSLKDDFGHAAAETYLITKLTFTLLKFLGIGYRWLGKLCALACYALYLMPGFLQVGYSYFFDKRIRRSITYGPSPRNRLDFYLPENMDSPKPVVAFVTGGAWIIGYKAWGSLLGLQLVEKDVIVACIDYRNFPQGTISDMVEDVKQGISFVCNNCASYGGDPDRVYLAGQSAGAHLAACALIDQAIEESRAETRSEAEGTNMGQQDLTWKASQLKAYFAISGGYNLPVLVDHFNNRGLYRQLFLSIMEGEESLLRYSPELLVQTLTGKARTLLPHVYLFHGTSDYSVPCDASISFGSALASCGAQVTTRLFEGKTHTDLFLQDPMRGGRDALFEEILAVIHVGDKEAQLKHAISEKRRRLVPEVLLQLARSVSPF